MKKAPPDAALPQSPHPGRCLVLCTGTLSILLSLSVVLPSVLLLVNSNSWNYIKQTSQQWLEGNHWDLKVLLPPEKWSVVLDHYR